MSKKEYTIICANCGQPFTATRHDAVYCSSKCRQAALRRKEAEAEEQWEWVEDIRHQANTAREWAKKMHKHRHWVEATRAKAEARQTRIEHLRARAEARRAHLEARIRLAQTDDQRARLEEKLRDRLDDIEARLKEKVTEQQAWLDDIEAKMLDFQKWLNEMWAQQRWLDDVQVQVEGSWGWIEEILPQAEMHKEWAGKLQKRLERFRDWLDRVIDEDHKQQDWVDTTYVMFRDEMDDLDDDPVGAGEKIVREFEIHIPPHPISPVPPVPPMPDMPPPPPPIPPIPPAPPEGTGRWTERLRARAEALGAWVNDVAKDTRSRKVKIEIRGSEGAEDIDIDVVEKHIHSPEADPKTDKSSGLRIDLV